MKVDASFHTDRKDEIRFHDDVATIRAKIGRVLDQTNTEILGAMPPSPETIPNFAPNAIIRLGVGVEDLDADELDQVHGKLTTVITEALALLPEHGFALSAIKCYDGGTVPGRDTGKDGVSLNVRLGVVPTKYADRVGKLVGNSLRETLAGVIPGFDIDI